MTYFFFKFYYDVFSFSAEYICDAHLIQTTHSQERPVLKYSFSSATILYFDEFNTSPLKHVICLGLSEYCHLTILLPLVSYQ